MNTVRCVGEGINTCVGKDMNTLSCVGKGMNTVSWVQNCIDTVKCLGIM